MNSAKKAILIGLIPCLLLAACGSKSEEEAEVYASSGKSAIFTLEDLMQRVVTLNRPSGTLGVFVSLYTSQGIILPTQSASLGIEAMKRFLEAQSRSDTDENFALLREVGAVLQEDIIDVLNRSTKRAETLDAYIQSLRNVIVLSERKVEELTVLYDNQRQETRDKRTEVRNLERDLRTALNDQDYGTASDIEESLAKANSVFAEIETKTEQTNDMIKRFEALLDIAKDRYQAVSNNREILIAGLRVIDVPGIKDLNILEKGSRWSRRGNTDIFN